MTAIDITALTQEEEFQAARAALDCFVDMELTCHVESILRDKIGYTLPDNEAGRLDELGAEVMWRLDRLGESLCPDFPFEFNADGEWVADRDARVIGEWHIQQIDEPDYEFDGVGRGGYWTDWVELWAAVTFRVTAVSDRFGVLFTEDVSPSAEIDIECEENTREDPEC